jgi:outer membrane biosynthesis protein TonB
MPSLYDKLMEKTIRESQHSPAVNPVDQPGEQKAAIAPPPVKKEAPANQKPKKNTPHDAVTPRYHGTMTGFMVSRHHKTALPSSNDTLVEEVRKAVGQFGKEPATQRLTTEEKDAISDIEYSYKRQGIETSGNEIIRIALNYLIREYRENGENSILAKVISKLNS